VVGFVNILPDYWFNGKTKNLVWLGIGKVGLAVPGLWGMTD